MFEITHETCFQIFYLEFSTFAKLPDCYEIQTPNAAQLLSSFRGVVGYHIRLTRGRSPVRTRTKTDTFFH